MYHTFLHHSQTEEDKQKAKGGLCTIHFYIILKRSCWKTRRPTCLCTIHFYIILKLLVQTEGLKTACVPYIFTSFSNDICSFSLYCELVYHTFLHHSQTNRAVIATMLTLVYHTFLHHSQTHHNIHVQTNQLVYHTFLHHSQTLCLH